MILFEWWEIHSYWHVLKYDWDTISVFDHTSISWSFLQVNMQVAIRLIWFLFCSELVSIKISFLPPLFIHFFKKRIKCCNPRSLTFVIFDQALSPHSYCSRCRPDGLLNRKKATILWRGVYTEWPNGSKVGSPLLWSNLSVFSKHVVSSSSFEICRINCTRDIHSSFLLRQSLGSVVMKEITIFKLSLRICHFQGLFRRMSWKHQSDPSSLKEKTTLHMLQDEAWGKVVAEGVAIGAHRLLH